MNKEFDWKTFNPTLNCKRCKHKWVRRNWDDLPKVCPKCKSPYWNKERVKK